MTMRIGKSGALFLWALVCLTTFFVVQTALQACSRTLYAFSRDKALPDRGFFSVMNGYTGTPIRTIWLTTVHQEKPLQLGDASRSYDRLAVLAINYTSPSGVFLKPAQRKASVQAGRWLAWDQVVSNETSKVVVTRHTPGGHVSFCHRHSPSSSLQVHALHLLGDCDFYPLPPLSTTSSNANPARPRAFMLSDLLAGQLLHGLYDD